MVRKNRHPDAEKIRSLTWDATIGLGLVGDDFPDEPDQDTLSTLARILGRPLTADDHRELENQWHQRRMEAAFP